MANNNIRVARIASGACPCYQCDDRYPACHGYCESYKQYRQTLDNLNEKAVQDQKRQDDYYTSRGYNKKGSQP